VSSPNQAQYAIDIAARMTGATYTSAQLDELTATLSGAGRNAEHFELAIQKVSGELEVAKAAASAANSALGLGTDEYKQLERAALNASKAAERAALKNKGVVPDSLQAKVTAANAALSSQANVLRGLEGAAKGAATKEADLARSLGNVRVMSDHVDKAMLRGIKDGAREDSALKMMNGTLGGLWDKLGEPIDGFDRLSVTMGKSRAAAVLCGMGLASLIMIAFAVAAAVALVSVAVTLVAIKLADSARSAGLTREAFAALSPAMATAQQHFDAITASTGLNDERLRGLTKSLISARVATAQLPSALNAAALAEAALGQGGAQQFIDQLAAGTLTVDKFASTVQDKFGNIVARRMLGLEVQGARLRYNFAAVFGSLDIEPALQGLSRLVGLLDKDSASGQSLKILFGAIFQPFINQADNASVSVEAFVLGLEIGLMKIYLASRPTLDAIGEFAKTLLGIDSSSLTTWKERGEALAGVIVSVAKWAAVLFGGLIALGVVIGIAVTAVFALVGALAALVVGIGFAIGYGIGLLLDALKWAGEACGNFVYNVVQAVVAVPAAFVAMGAKVVGWFQSFSLADLGLQLITGLVAGIASGAGAVVGAVQNAVQGAINKAKSLLGIASPSKVFAMIGQRTSEGFAEGVDDGAPDATSAMSSLVSPPTSALSAFDALSGNFGAPALAPASAPAPATPGGGGASINLSGATIAFNGVADAPTGIKQFGDLLTQALEGDAAMLGAAVVYG
jgi:hypothetical protein